MTDNYLQLIKIPSLKEVYYPQPSLLVEGLNAKDLLLDILQIALDTGAIAITGGAGGDTVVDVLIAIEVGTDIIAEVENVISQARELGSILSAAVSLNLTSNVDGFYEEVKTLAKRITSNETVGEDAKSFIETASETLEDIISRLVRAIGKWVSALFPDDFGLAGPAFEAAIGTAKSSTVDNSYNLAASALEKLGDTAELITSEQALNNWAADKISSILGPLQEILDVLAENDEEKKGWFASMAWRVVRRVSLARNNSSTTVPLPPSWPNVDSLPLHPRTFTFSRIAFEPCNEKVMPSRKRCFQSWFPSTSRS